MFDRGCLPVGRRWDGRDMSGWSGTYRHNFWLLPWFQLEILTSETATAVARQTLKDLRFNEIQ
jgi:hypothetical protein